MKFILITLILLTSLRSYGCFDFYSCCLDSDPLAKIITEKLSASSCDSAQSKLLSIKRLVIRNREITKIDSIRDLHELEFLDLSHNKITELWPLEELKHLKSLKLNTSYVSKNKLFDIWSLSHLIKLESLELRGQDIIDLSPLASLGNLKSLDLSGNIHIEDFSILADFFYLEDFSFRCIESELNHRPVACSKTPFDLKLISSLPGLKRLDLAYNGITGLGNIGGLAQLQFLDLRYNPLKDSQLLSILFPLAQILLDEIEVEEAK